MLDVHLLIIIIIEIFHVKNFRKLEQQLMQGNLKHSCEQRIKSNKVIAKTTSQEYFAFAIPMNENNLKDLII